MMYNHTCCSSTCTALPSGHAICCAGVADSDPFNASNRMGLDGTLHRVSAIRGSDKQRSILGLIYRLGRHISGLLCLLASADVLCHFHSLASRP